MKCYKCGVKVMPSNFCNHHYPSWIVRQAIKLDFKLTKLKFLFKASRRFKAEDVDDMIALDDLEKTVSGAK